MYSAKSAFLSYEKNQTFIALLRMLMSVDTSLALWLVTLSVNISYCTDYLQSSQAYHEQFLNFKLPFTDSDCWDVIRLAGQEDLHQRLQPRLETATWWPLYTCLSSFRPKVLLPTTLKHISVIK